MRYYGSYSLAKVALVSFYRMQGLLDLERRENCQYGQEYQNDIMTMGKVSVSTGSISAYPYILVLPIYSSI
jgi:hypothetical protein